MNLPKLTFTLMLSYTLLSCSANSLNSDRQLAQSADPFEWLEEIEGDKALDWAKAHNNATMEVLKGDAKFASIESDLRKIILAKDRIPAVGLTNGWLYNFWQDAEHVRGVWRRTSIENYKQADIAWETILDLDALAKEENENWVWKGSQCLPPEYNLCLISLSRGGKDAKVVREFDIKTKSFVKNGFYLPEAKQNFSWIDKDTLFVATDFGPGSISSSGYPLISKKWTRGTPLSEAKEVFRAQPTDMSAMSYAFMHPEKTYLFHNRALSFFEGEDYYEDGGKQILIQMPRDANFVDVYESHFLYQLRSDLKTDGKTYLKGSLVGLPIKNIAKNTGKNLKVYFTPSKKRFLLSASVTKSALLINVLDNVKGKVLSQTIGSNVWEEIPFKGTGMASESSSSPNSDELLLSYTDFLTPTSIFYTNATKPKAAPQLLKQSPKRFNSENLISEQWFATSRDGTKIPYFIVHTKNMKMNGTNPTLLYGYGGFELPLTPGYMGGTGKVWLEKGGVYVMANIRGGGEFGPAWHQAAQRENKQKSYDDFIAVAEDLIKRGVASPATLGIQGGSNGGLLVGATFVQRPDLFNAVLCEVPLLDMMRYHKLLAGASWMEEYGNPDDPAMREVILKYSPYQNVKTGAKYPQVFFFTSTRDDRVHPGHARKMVAKMESLGNSVYYFENTEGGHGGSANLEQRILISALEYTYLWRKLGGN